MRFVVMSKIVGLCLLLFFGSGAIAGDGPKCIANICLDGKHFSLKRATKILGPSKGNTARGIAYQCYDVNSGAVLRVGYLQGSGSVVSLLLSRSESCAPTGRSRLDVNHLITENGIGLGSSAEEVKGKYGEPVKKVDPEIAYKRWLSDDSGAYLNRGDLDELWVYGPDINTSLVRGFAIYHGKVVGIFLQDSP